MTILFSTGCPNCRTLKTLLDEKHIPYTENTSVEEMLSLSIQKVPMLCVNGDLLDYSAAMDWVYSYKEECNEKQ